MDDFVEACLLIFVGVVVVVALAVMAIGCILAFAEILAGIVYG